MFVEPEHLPFCRAVDRHIETVRNELDRAWRGRFRPWPQRGGYRGQWDLLPLFASDDYDVPGTLRADGRANQPSFPRTMELVADIEGACLAAFSCLGPQTFVSRHFDEDVPPVVRCHLGLLVPSGCTLDLDDESREHANGRWVCFHGATPHAARNASRDTPRVTLMIDVRRSAYPEAIRQAERRQEVRGVAEA